MILILYITFLILSFVLVTIGYTFYKTTVSDILIIVGWTFVFALGIIMLSNGVEYNTGVTIETTNTYIEYNYVLDGTNYTDIVLNTSQTTETKDYKAFSTEGTGVLARVSNSHLWGFLLMIAGLFGEILFWFDVKAYGKKIEEIQNE